MKKWQKRSIRIVAVVIVLFVGGGVIVGNFFYNMALNPAADKSRVLQAPHNELTIKKEAIAEGTDIEMSNDEWFATVDASDVYMSSYDALKLHATAIKNQAVTNKWAIICHGYGGYGLQMTASARKFQGLGYHVLLPDARGGGESEGDYIGMGWHERIDMTDWIKKIIDENGEDVEIVLYGVSMGGATVMMTAGEQLPQQVKAIVEDCGYTSAKAEFSYQLKAVFGLPAFPIINFSSGVAKVRAGFTLGEASALEQVKKSETPILFIHGGEDTFVPASMVKELYEAATCEKELYIVEGAGHGGASSVENDIYWKKIGKFISR